MTRPEAADPGTKCERRREAEIPDMLFVCTPHTDPSSRAGARPPTADITAIVVPLFGQLLSAGLLVR